MTQTQTIELAMATCGWLLLNVAFLYRQPWAAVLAGCIYAAVLWKH